jgi:hypothetical protein
MNASALADSTGAVVERSRSKPFDNGTRLFPDLSEPQRPGELGQVTGELSRAMPRVLGTVAPRAPQPDIAQLLTVTGDAIAVMIVVKSPARLHAWSMRALSPLDVDGRHGEFSVLARSLPHRDHDQ